MTVSASSVLLSCFEAGGMILILNLMLGQRKCRRFVHIDAILFLTGLIFARLFFPVAPFFTVRIQVPSVMNPVMAFLKQETAVGLSVLECLIGIWCAGIAVKGGLYWRRCLLYEQVAARIRERAVRSSVRELHSSPLLPDYPVYLSKDVRTPGIMGRDRSILLPDEPCTQFQLDCILQHEVRHLENHDYCKRQLAEFLIILYWWFLPVYLLRRSVLLCTEAVADGEAVWNQPEQGQLEYAGALIQMQKRIAKQEGAENSKPMDSFFNSFTAGGSRILTWRVDRLLEPGFLRRTSGLCLTVLAVSAFVSCLFSVEPKFDPPAGSFAWSEAELVQSGSLICTVDGNWKFMIDGEVFEVQDPLSEFLVGVPVLYEGEVPVKRERSGAFAMVPAVEEQLMKVSSWKFQNTDGRLSKRLWNEAAGSWISSWIPV